MTTLGRALIGDTACHGEIEDDRFHVIVGDVLGAYRRNGQSFPLEDVTLGTPLEGVRFFNVMAGFVEPDTARDPGRLPMWLPKATAFATGDHGEVQVPTVLTGPVQMESELALVVGRPLRNASVSEAADAIFGWTVFNDLTATEFGFGQATPLWATAKSIDGFTSWGPWIRRDLSEDRVVEGLGIHGYVNGEQRQVGNSRWFAFTPSEMLSHVSHLIGLAAGDVLALGTPYPAPDVKVGDRLACEVEEVGRLHNYVVADEGNEPRVWPRSVRVPLP
jgi:2-keto-4-pentenoate hydratase/2-oxohepta-3-ene-1,7-dioic acid hydratase in catechol pathway